MMDIAIITARQNSKGILRKNLQTVGNRSLLAHAMVAAQESDVFQRIIVSTDGQEIADEARRYGVEVVMRPSELASDTAHSIDAVCHVLHTHRIYSGSTTLLQPTSPLRTAQHICEAFALYQAQQFKGSVVSACLAEHHPYKMLLANGDDYVSVHDIGDLERARQQLPLAYRPNGAIYINDTESLLKYQRFFINPIQLYIMNAEDSLDIDDVADLVLANQIIHTRNTL